MTLYRRNKEVVVETAKREIHEQKQVDCLTLELKNKIKRNTALQTILNIFNVSG